MIFAVIDTNVLVSALLAKSEKSTILQLINAILQDKLTTLYNEEITKEYFEVLSRSKFKFNPELKDELLASIQRHGIESTRIHTTPRCPMSQTACSTKLSSARTMHISSQATVSTSPPLL